MKRIFALLLACVLSLSLLTGCHGSRAQAAFVPPEELDTENHYEISFWAKNDTNKNQTDIYEKAIRDFEALYPNVTVKLRLYTDYGKIYNDVITNISTQTTPNVCITYPDHIATYLTGNNVVVPLDELFAHSRYGLGGSELRFDCPTAEELVPAFLSECSFAGHYYAVPYMRSTEACYVNKTYVEALGYTLPEVLTWDFVWEVSEAAMAKNEDGTYKVNGQSVMIPFIYKSTDNMMIQMTEQLQSGYSDAEGNIFLFNDTTRDLLYTVAEHAATGAFSTFKISSYPANFFNAGQSVFGVDSTAGSTWMGSHAPLSDISEDKRVEFETVVYPVPQFDTENPRMISQGPSLCVFNKSDDQEVLYSWLFTAYLLTNEVQIAYSETEGYVPVTTKAQESEEYREYLALAGTDSKEHYQIKMDVVQLLLDNTDNTFVTPVFNGSASLRDAAGQMIENVTKSVRRRQTVDEEYMDTLFSEVKSLYRLDQSMGTGAGEKQELGPLPPAARAFLGSLAGVWVLIALYFLLQKHKQQKNDHFHS